jgi:hypothetical protein
MIGNKEQRTGGVDSKGTNILHLKKEIGEQEMVGQSFSLNAILLKQDLQLKSVGQENGLF